MSDRLHLINALDAVEHQGETVPELTARIVLLFDRLAALDPEAARDLIRQLPAGWHGPRLVH